MTVGSTIANRRRSVGSRNLVFRSPGRQRVPTAWSRVSMHKARRPRACIAALTDGSTASRPSRPVGDRVLAVSKGRNRIVELPLGRGARGRMTRCQRPARSGAAAPDRQRQQGLRRAPRDQRSQFRAARRRDPCAARRKRRREIDAEQGDRRRDHAHVGRLSGRGPQGFVRVAQGGARRRRRHGLPGIEPRSLDDGRAESRTGHGKLGHGLQQDQHRRDAVVAVDELQCRSAWRSSKISEPPSVRWSRSCAPCATTRGCSSSTNPPPRSRPKRRSIFSICSTP